MKKIVLITLAGMLSLASVSSYAATSLTSMNNTAHHANCSGDIGDGQAKQFKDTNLYPDPHVNNK